MRKNYSHDVYTFTTLTLNHIKINDIYTYKKIPKEQKSEIKTMLLELGLDRNFEKNLFFKMRYDNYTFYNEVINALRISIELTSKSLNNAFLAPMQSGKTGTIKFLCNTILPNINFLNPDESVLFLTSMTDVDLRDQNIRTLENGDSNIIVLSMSKFKRSGIEIVKRNNVKLIVRDEDQYGCGYESSFDFGFFSNLRMIIPHIPLLSVSATPFDVIDAKFKGLDVNLIFGIRNSDYFGITEMLGLGLIKDIGEKYQHFEAQNDKTFISKPIQKCIFHLKKFEKGLGIIRCDNTAHAVELRNQLKSIKDEFNIIIIGCKSDCDFSIKEGLRQIPKMIKNESKRVIMLVINALSAGKDLKNLKKDVKFIIETRKNQLANCAQGLPGRICGYHSNRDLLIYANKSILEHFSDFEMSPDIIYDEDWINSVYFDEKVKTLSTHTNLKREHYEGSFVPIINCFEISVNELFLNEGEKKLKFLTADQQGLLISYFEKKVYNDNFRVGGLRNKFVQLRISSNYKRYNTVFKSWNKKIGDNFKSLFNHKGDISKFGILISNYPENDERNKIGFCGIKVFVSGEMTYRKRLAVTTNRSMYMKEVEKLDS